MTFIRLQYSVICRQLHQTGLSNIIHGFTTGLVREFYVVNKWVWDDLDIADDGFYQVTEIAKGDEILAVSRSGIFHVKLSHTHQNYFNDILFSEEGDYRIKVGLYDRDDELIAPGSLDYPLFVKKYED